MGSDSTWVSCAHVMNGCANHVKIRPGKVCLCSSCFERINLERTKEICILDETRLKCLLKDIEQVDGSNYFDNIE